MLAENAMVRHAMSPKALFALPSRLRQEVCKRHQATFPLVRVIGLPSANLRPS